MVNENELAREARNRYLREWRAKNPARVKAMRDRYWIRRAQKLMNAEREEKHGEK